MNLGKDVPSIIERAANFAIARNFSEARDLLQILDLEAVRRERAQLQSSTHLARCQQSKRQRIKTPRKDASRSEMLRTFRRDRFTCRYSHCQRKTIYIEVLKELSRLFPDQLPYHRNWKFDSSHLLYWVYGTSLEHKLSFPHGGDSSEANLITACYLCNDTKGD